MGGADVELADSMAVVSKPPSSAKDSGVSGVIMSSLRECNDPSVINDPRKISMQKKVVGSARSIVSSLRNPDGSMRDDATKLQPEDGEADHHGPARVSAWYQTSFNLMAEIMGTGILSLPSTMAGLGYVLGTIAILVFAFGVYYSGFLLSKVRNKYYKQVLSYGDVAYILHGRIFEQCVRWLMYANWYALMSYYILALTSSLQSAFYWREDICFWSWGFIAIVILLPFIQLRTFHAISYASFLSTVAIIVAVAIIAAAFITGGTEEQASDFIPATWKVPPQGFLAGYSNLANIIFAYQGQSEFYEMASEMKEPRKFPISLLLSQSIMTFMYLFTALLAYSYGGQNVNGFILYSLPENSMRTVCAILVGIHVIVAYMITNQPLTYKAHEAVSSSTLHATGLKPQLIHLAITSAFLLMGFVIANLIPFFADMQGIISAFAASPIVFFFPAYFYMRASMNAGDWKDVPIYEKAYLFLMMGFITPFCFFVGLVSAFDGIIAGWSTAGLPFACIKASQL